MTAPADIKLVIAQVKDEPELFQALAIREVVFIEEQHVPETIERDAEDARAYHLLAHREHGVGSLLLGELEGEARRRGLTGVLVHSQLYALGFYEGHGYRPVGPVFEEAGIDHVEAHKRIG